MIGYGELIVILLLIMFLFGGKKLPEFARNLGVGVREFKKALNSDASTDAEADCSNTKCKGDCSKEDK